MKFAQMLRSHKEMKKEELRASGEAEEYILIVKKDAGESALFKRNLESLGYRVRAVGSGIEALKMLEGAPPTLIISDIMLEGMKGHELCRTIKTDPATSAIPFMFISSPDSTPDKTLGFQGYGDDYINSPFDISVLKNRVESLLRRSRNKIRATDEQIGVKRSITIIPDDEAPHPYRVTAEAKEIPQPTLKAESDGFTHEELESSGKIDEFDSEMIEPETAKIESEKGVEAKFDNEAHIDLEMLPLQLNFPPIEEALSQKAKVAYSSGRLIFEELQRTRGKFGRNEYLYIVKYIENLVDKTLADNSLLSLALGIDAHPNLASHSVNTAIISVRIARNLGFSANELPLLGFSAFIFDVGMVKVKPEILHKKGELTLIEREQVKKHIKHSIDIIELALKSEFPKDCEYITSTVYQHHEREQGQGYPQGLMGDRINLSSKIIGLADTYEAMCHTRFHRLRQTTYRALQEVVGMKKTHFDPLALKALVNELTFFPLGCYVRLNTDEVGIVVDTSSVHSMRPTVKIFLDSDGDEVRGEKIVNLVESPFLYVVKPLEDEDVPELL